MSCVFLRSEIENVVSVQLVEAKSKVAPKKYYTWIGIVSRSYWSQTRSIHQTVQRFSKPFTYFWSINRDFVENQVKQVKFITTKQWKHIPGQLNPAAIASRTLYW